jgi:hypothetical protein
MKTTSFGFAIALLASSAYAQESAAPVLTPMQQLVAASEAAKKIDHQWPLSTNDGVGVKPSIIVLGKKDSTKDGKTPTWQIETWKTELSKAAGELMIVDYQIGASIRNPRVSVSEHQTLLDAAVPYRSSLRDLISRLRIEIRQAETANASR